MSQELRFGLVISADGKTAIRTLDEIDTSLDKVDKSAKKAGSGTSSTFNRLRQRAKQTASSLKNMGSQSGWLNQKLGSLKSTLADAANRTSNFQQGLVNTVGKLTLFGGAVGAVTSALSIGTLVDTQRQFDVLNSQLITATGGTKQAAAAFDELTKFASTTPYALEQSVQGFVQLKNLGLDPSMRSMRSYGNFAAAMGKDLNQMIEAVADASTFEFERLKEFGIKASQQGDKVSFTFQGVTTTVAKNSQAIQEYLLAIGENKFGDAMANRAKTLDGAISNLGDNFNAFKLAIVQSGIGEVIQDIVVRVADGLGRMTDALKEPENASKLKSVITSVGDAFNQLKDYAQQAGDVINQVTDFFAENQEMVIPLASGIGAAAGAFLLFNAAVAAWTAIGTAATAVTTGFGIAVGIATSPVTLILGAIAGLVAVGVYLYRNWDELSAKASAVWQGIKDYVSNAWEGVKAKTSEVWEGIKAKVAEVWDGIKQKVADTVASLPQPVQEMITNIQSMFAGAKEWASMAFEFIASKAKWVVDKMTTLWSGAKEIFSQVWNGFSAAISVVFESVKTIVVSSWENIKSIFRASLQVIKALVTAQWESIKLVFSTAFDAIKGVTSTAWTTIKALFSAGITAIAIVFNTGFETVKTVVKTAFNALKALAKGDIEGFKATIQSGLDKLKGIASTAISQFVTAFDTLKSKLMQIGRDAVQGLINGVREKIKGAIDVARNLASSVSDTVKNFFIIRSPSRLFKQYGGFLSEGLAIGIKGKQSEAVQAALNLAQNVSNAMGDIKRDIALFGNDNPLTRFDYDREHGAYTGIKDSVLDSYRALIKAKEDLITKTEQENKLAEAKKAEADKVANFTTQLRDQMADYAFETSLIGKQAGEVARLRFEHRLMAEQKNALKDVSDKNQKIIKKETAAILEQYTLESKIRAEKQNQQKLADFVKKQQSQLADYEFETSLIGKKADEVARLRFERDLLNQAEQAGIVLSEQVKQKITAEREALIALREQQQALQDKDWVAGIQSGFHSLVDGAKSLNQTMRDATTGAFNKMSDSFANFVATGKGSFKDLTASILQDISKMLIKFALLRLAKAAVGMFENGGAFGSGGLLALAKGGAFNTHGIQYYANGDIFDKPTMFRHAGGIGVMGEAGAEAVMPLTRGANGKLGVQVYGNKQTNKSAGVVNQVKIDIHINNDGASSDVQTTAQDSKQLAESLKAVVLQTLQNEMRSGGMLAAR